MTSHDRQDTAGPADHRNDFLGATALGHTGRMGEFDDATQVADDGSTEIRDGWDIGGNANGGYLMALAASGLRQVAGRPDPITVTAHYLSPGRPGPAAVEGEVVKAGKRFTTVTGRLVSAGRPVIQVLGAFGDLGAVPGAASDAGSDAAAVRGIDDVVVVHGAPPDLPPPDQCVRRERGQGNVPVPMVDRIDIRLHPDHTGWLRDERAGVGEMAGWCSFVDGRPFDTLSLLLVADVLPPAVFGLPVPAGWVPTVELTVHVRARPAPGPLRCVFRTRFVHGGMFEEDGQLWDSDGTLVALSRQLALLPR